MSDTNSQPIEVHQPCEACGSSDALCTYEDHTFCFSCRDHKWTTESKPKVRMQMNTDLITGGVYKAIQSRRLSEDTCKKYGYTLAKVGGKLAHIAPYRNQKGELAGQKLRFQDKQFATRGNMSDVQLFGQSVWKAGGKRLVICEGELDCLSYHQVTKTWPVVSIPQGCQSAVGAIKRNIEFVESFDEVCFFYDSDTHGQDAAKACADIITPGKATIVTLDKYKDASDMVVANDVKGLMNAVYNAKPHRPDGVINGKEIWDAVSRPTVLGTPYAWKGFNDILFGLRPREIVCLTAGSGVGKSTIAAQIAYDLAVNQNKTVGYVALEESLGRTGLRFLSYALERPMHLPQEITEAERRDAFARTLGTGRFLLYDHFGSMDSDHLLQKLKYMVHGCGAEFLFIDHLSILLSGGDFMVSGGDERKQIDYTMSKLRQFTEETGVGMVLISHLKRASGDKGFEDGMKPNLSSLRGSQSIAQLSDCVLAVSRNASAGDNEITVSCLKNRYSGITGHCANLQYNQTTGLLQEVTEFEEGMGIAI